MKGVSSVLLRGLLAACLMVVGCGEEPTQPEPEAREVATPPELAQRRDAIWGAYWGSFQRDGCTYQGKRQHSSILWGIPWGYSWETACANTPATVMGQSFSRPTRCVNTGSNMWGEFDVNDSSCFSTWGGQSAGSCVSETNRTFTAMLENIPSKVTWESACASTGAWVNGTWFARPTRCVNVGWGMRGEWDAPDTACRPYWGSFQNDGCKAVDRRQYASILWNIPPGASWESTCARTPASVAGTSFSAPSRCVNTGTNMWGQFDVFDTSCRANWGAVSAEGSCSGLGKRKHSAQILNVPPGQSWEQACTGTPITLNGQTFSTPARCINQQVGGMWGEWYVNDTSCNGVWGTFKPDNCLGSNLRQYSGQISVPSGVSWEEACANTPATVAGQFFSSPTRCKKAAWGVGGMWGEFDVHDTSCGGPTPIDASAWPLPPKFLWGVGLSSYQTEGGIDCSLPGGVCNDFDLFSRSAATRDCVAFTTSQAGPAVQLEPAAVANRFFEPEFYKRDFDNARLLGLNSFRISLEWGRIEPQPGVFNDAAIAQYRQMILEMRERGLTPVVTLNHFTLPAWVLTPSDTPQYTSVGDLGVCGHDGNDADFLTSLKGWESASTVAAYERFVRKVVPQLSDQVDVWLTINEPVASQVVVGYVAGLWSPGFFADGTRARAALHNLLEAHVRAYDAITALDTLDSNGDGITKQVGLAHHMGPSRALPPGFLGDGNNNADAADNFSYFMNEYLLNALAFGREDLTYLLSVGEVSKQDVSPTQQPRWVRKLDFVGINYYRRFHVYQDVKITPVVGFVGGSMHNNMWGEPAPHEQLNDLGWTVYPQGLYEMVMMVHRQYGLPVLISEHGTPEHTDRNRAASTLAHLRELTRAMNDGARVFGYLHWTIADNWELHEGYHAPSRFGLFRISDASRQNGTLRRELTEGALGYQLAVEESVLASTKGQPTLATLDRAQARFGAFTADGAQVLPPSRGHGRFFSGTASTGAARTLYLTSVGASPRVTGMLYRGEMDRWSKVDLGLDSSGAFLRERWHDDALGLETSLLYRLSYDGTTWQATSTNTAAGASWTAALVKEAGLWTWDTGQSPWGNSAFLVHPLGGSLAGKFLTFSQPEPLDEPSPVCGLPGCTPDVSGQLWRTFGGVRLEGGLMRLDGQGPEGEDSFDVSVQLASGLAGEATATSVARFSGSFKAKQKGVVAASPLRMTGYVMPAGDAFWEGRRDASDESSFLFSEQRRLFLEYASKPAPIGGKADQYRKENDPIGVMPLATFASSPVDPLTRVVSFEAGGRSYSMSVAAPCGVEWDCEGTWKDVSNRVARRVPERFVPLAYAGPARTVAAGASVTLTGVAFDVDRRSLSTSWTGSFGTLNGTTVTITLPVGSHSVCFRATSSTGTGQHCTQVVVQ